MTNPRRVRAYHAGSFDRHHDEGTETRLYTDRDGPLKFGVRSELIPKDVTVYPLVVDLPTLPEAEKIYPYVTEIIPYYLEELFTGNVEEFFNNITVHNYIDFNPHGEDGIHHFDKRYHSTEFVIDKTQEVVNLMHMDLVDVISIPQVRDWMKTHDITRCAKKGPTTCVLYFVVRPHVDYT